MRSALIVTALALVTGLVANGSSAQTAGRVTATLADDVPMDDYLGLLAQISPAAREGAQAYLQAFQRRCGRALTPQELRRAVSDGDGEPVGLAKARAYDHRALEPIQPTVIPPGHYYVQGTSPDSFDSRYRSSGLVRVEQVSGVVQPLF